MSMLTTMDLKAAPSDTLERTPLLAWARPAQHTQVCLKGSHTRSHLHGEFETCLALWQSIMCHTHVVSNEKNMLPQKKTCLSMSSLPRLLQHPNTHQPECLSTSPTMNLRNLQHPRLRSPAVCTGVPASFASHVFAHNSSHAPPSQLNPQRTLPLSFFWPTNDTSLPDDARRTVSFASDCSRQKP